MSFRFPVRRYLQHTERIETPRNRFGALQWVLARPLYRFQKFDLLQVPAKNRHQALKLELAQWTPFANSGYFVGWRGSQALVWAWNADKVNAAIQDQRLNLNRLQILPETLLQAPQASGLCLIQCAEGFEGQLWRDNVLDRSRWWPHVPQVEEWLNFQRDAAVLAAEQQSQPPALRSNPQGFKPWVKQSSPDGGLGAAFERPVMALGLLFLFAPAMWFGLNLIKTQESTALLREQQAQLQLQAKPILQARGEALDNLARINALQSLAKYPNQLTLMGTVADVLPKDGSTLKEWDFSGGVLKMSVTAAKDVSATPIIDVLQQAGIFRDVKSLSGPDPKSVMFQMKVMANPCPTPQC